MGDWKSALAIVGMMSALATGDMSSSAAAPKFFSQQEESPDDFVKKILAIPSNDWTEGSSAQLADMFLSKNFARIARNAMKTDNAATAWFDPFSGVSNDGRVLLSEKTVSNDRKTAIVEAMMKYITPEARTPTITAKIIIYLVYENGWKVDEVLHTLTQTKSKDSFRHR